MQKVDFLIWQIGCYRVAGPPSANIFYFQTYKNLSLCCSAVPNSLRTELNLCIPLYLIDLNFRWLIQIDHVATLYTYIEYFKLFLYISKFMHVDLGKNPFYCTKI